MIIKEAIGTYKSNQLKSHYRKLAMLGAPRKVIEVCRDLAQKFLAGQFIIHAIPDWVEPESKGKTWKVDTYADANTEDTALSSTPVIKIEGARGHVHYEGHNEPKGVLKLTTADNVYYYDGEEILSTDISELFAVIDEEFEEITL